MISATIANLRAHDLLRVSPGGVSALCGAAGFSSLPLEDFPFVVVRRAAQKDGLVPVGIRGMERHERRAAWLHPAHIIARFTPESIRPAGLLPDLPAFRALRELERRWEDARMPWGPSGSMGFELVSGCHAVHGGSDLDLVVRAATPLPPDCLHMLARAGEDLSCAIDIQVETPSGAFSPKEYMTAPARCLLRTVEGARLVNDPWRGRWRGQSTLEKHE